MNCSTCKFKTCTSDGIGKDFCFYNIWDDIPTNPDTCEFYAENKLPTLDELNNRQQKEKPKPEPSEFGKTYLAKLKESTTPSLSFEAILGQIETKRHKPKAIIAYPYTTEQCRDLFDKVYANLLAKQRKQPIIDDDYKIGELVKYFSGHPGKLDPYKGIYLSGIVGVGKSILMEAFNIFCNTIEGRMKEAGKEVPGRGFRIFGAKAIVLEITEHKKPENLKRYYDGPICIDDFGVEDALKHYGNDLDVIADIIIQRYNRYQQNGLITHATSNLTSLEWKARYGDRIESRCNEMFNLVPLIGDDKRKNLQTKINVG